MTSTYRSHLKNHHGPIYEQVCVVKNLKNASRIGHVAGNIKDMPLKFTEAAFYHLLMRWIIVDDQVRVFNHIDEVIDFD